jgi:hypothetical protein
MKFNIGNVWVCNIKNKIIYYVKIVNIQEDFIYYKYINFPSINTVSFKNEHHLKKKIFELIFKYNKKLSTEEAIKDIIE